MLGSIFFKQKCIAALCLLVLIVLTVSIKGFLPIVVEKQNEERWTMTQSKYKNRKTVIDKKILVIECEKSRLEIDPLNNFKMEENLENVSSYIYDPKISNIYQFRAEKAKMSWPASQIFLPKATVSVINPDKKDLLLLGEIDRLKLSTKGYGVAEHFKCEFMDADNR